VILLGLLLPAFYFNRLPEAIPVHFNFFGRPDGFGSKLAIWVLPLISALLYAGLHLLPKLIESQKPKPKEDARLLGRKQHSVLGLLIILKTILSFAFTYITLATIMVAFDDWAGLGWAFLPVFLVGALILPVGFAIRISAMK